VDAVEKLRQADAVRRLADRDPSLFSDDAEVQAAVSNRLGWVSLAARATAEAAPLAEAGKVARTTGIENVVLLGMGGSSLAPLVLSQIVGNAPGSPALHVLDTTSPWVLARMENQFLPERTLVVVSSKSGTTIEPLSLYGLFRVWFDSLLHERAGEHFLAVTDPDSPLEKLASDHGFAAVFHAPPDVGGRYSALTTFGTVPISLIGMDVARLAASAAYMEQSCHADVDVNPAATLAAWIANAHAEGRDKLTLVFSEPLAPFGLWIEQLVAESTGKNGTGIIPVLETGPGEPEAYGPDRLVFVYRTPGDDTLAALPGRLPEGVPCMEVVLTDVHDLGGEFVRWETATALTGFLLGINPFDEPNVAEAKKATSDILGGSLRMPEPQMQVGETLVTSHLPGSTPATGGTLATPISDLLDGAGPGSYLAVLAYLPEDEELMIPLREAVAALARARRLACTLEIGPRYLHSTGQLHKGGPKTGRFLIVTARDNGGPPIPGQPFTLAQLHRAQAEGDFVTLMNHGLPVVRVDLPEPAHGPVRLIAETLRGLG
jgi:glucose-6-phosphate isomerase